MKRGAGLKAAGAWLAAACLLGGVSLPRGSSAADAAGAQAWPKAAGSVFALLNTDITSPLIAFDAKGRELMAFNCATRGRALIGRFYDLVCDGGSFLATDAGTWTGMQVAKSGAFTLELTAVPAAARPAARGIVLCYGNDKGEDLALLQDGAGLSLRVGSGEPVSLFAPEAGKPVHVVVACEGGKWSAYRDGEPVRSGAFASAPSPWVPREIVLGSSWAGAEPWKGRLDGIAIFPRALTAAEAAGEFAALRAVHAGRKPATTLRFRGSLTRQAKTSALEQIRPYTRSLTSAEYKVEQVLSGEWKEPTITVLHWMIMDGKRLPIADRQPGAKVELTVQRIEDNPQLESCRRDEIEGDVALDLFYCESEEGIQP